MVDLVKQLREVKDRDFHPDSLRTMVLWGADEIERLRNENAHLQFCLNSRDDFIGSIGQWQAYVDTLPEKKAGVPGGWSENPSVTTEQKVSGERP